MRLSESFSGIRQRVDDVNQELQEKDRIICAGLVVGIAVSVLLCCAVQGNCAGNCLVQQDCVCDIYSAVQVDVAL